MQFEVKFNFVNYTYMFQDFKIDNNMKKYVQRNVITEPVCRLATQGPSQFNHITF